MNEEEQREQVVRMLSDLLRRNPFTFELKVKKRPKGIRVISEVTEDEMKRIMEMQARERGLLQ